MLMDGAVSISVRRFAENFWPTSRRRRTTTGALHMPMKILQDEHGFERHCLHRGQRLHRIKSVINGSFA